MRYIKFAGHLSAHVSSKLWLFGPFLDFEKSVCNNALQKLHVGEISSLISRNAVPRDNSQTDVIALFILRNVNNLMLYSNLLRNPYMVLTLQTECNLFESSLFVSACELVKFLNLVCLHVFADVP